MRREEEKRGEALMCHALDKEDSGVKPMDELTDDSDPSLAGKVHQFHLCFK